MYGNVSMESQASEEWDWGPGGQFLICPSAKYKIHDQE